MCSTELSIGCPEYKAPFNWLPTDPVSLMNSALPETSKLLVEQNKRLPVDIPERQLNAHLIRGAQWL